MQKTRSFCPYISREYYRIISGESQLLGRPWSVPTAEEMYGTARQIIEYAKQATIIRSYAHFYNLSDDKLSWESDGAHVSLMLAMIEATLSYLYDDEFQEGFLEQLGYDYFEITQAVRRHDLAENDIGDIPDNSWRDDDAKIAKERAYRQEFGEFTPPRSIPTEKRVRRLLYEMEEKSSPAGRLIYTVDKASAVIMALTLDLLKHPPIRYRKDANLSPRDLREMDTCDYAILGGYLASEMWTVDYLRERRLVAYDQTGYITALIVMTTLIVRGHWYNWRDRDYI